MKKQRPGKVEVGVMWCDNQQTEPRYYMGLTIVNNEQVSEPYVTVEISCEQWHSWDTDGKALRVALNKIKKLDPEPGSLIKYEK